MTLEPPTLTTTRRIKRIAPLQLGKILGLLYGCLGLLFLPILLVAAIAGQSMPAAQRVGFMAIGVGFALVAPVLYGGLGFIFGCLTALLYNVAAKFVGGLEVDVE